jgi:hypothetical protein
VSTILNWCEVPDERISNDVAEGVVLTAGEFTRLVRDVLVGPHSLIDLPHCGRVAMRA